MGNEIGVKINKIGNGSPVVALVYCMHGDEVLGKKVVAILAQELEPVKGSVLTVLANEKAFRRNKRFIDKDLNRVFPGKEDGNHEERVAHTIKKLLKSVDFVVDIHSTTSITEPFSIITKQTRKILNTVKKSGPEKIVLMDNSLAEGKSLIDHVPNGISLEYSSRTPKKSFTRAYKDIKGILSAVGILDDKPIKKRAKEFYKMTGSIPMRRGFKVKGLFKNFSKIKKNQTYGTVNSIEMKASSDFYPVFYGEKAYADMLSFTSAKNPT